MAASHATDDAHDEIRVEIHDERGVPRRIVFLPVGVDLPPVCVRCGRVDLRPDAYAYFQLSTHARGLRYLMDSLVSVVLPISLGRRQDTNLPMCARHRVFRRALLVAAFVPGFTMFVIALATFTPEDGMNREMAVGGFGAMVICPMLAHLLTVPVHVVRMSADGAWIDGLPARVIDTILES